MNVQHAIIKGINQFSKLWDVWGWFHFNLEKTVAELSLELLQVAMAAKHKTQHPAS